MFGIGIDGVAEEHKLEQRHADHHRERHAVPPHLDEFLDHDGQEPRHGKDAVAVHGEKLSFELSMRWMKTSSSPDLICFQSCSGVRKGAMARSSTAASSPLT